MVARRLQCESGSRISVTPNNFAPCLCWPSRNVERVLNPRSPFSAEAKRERALMVPESPTNRLSWWAIQFMSAWRNVKTLGKPDNNAGESKVKPRITMAIQLKASARNRWRVDARIGEYSPVYGELSGVITQGTHSAGLV